MNPPILAWGQLAPLDLLDLVPDVLELDVVHAADAANLSGNKTICGYDLELLPAGSQEFQRPLLSHGPVGDGSRRPPYLGRRTLRRCGQVFCLRRVPEERDVWRKQDNLIEIEAEGDDERGTSWGSWQTSLRRGRARHDRATSNRRYGTPVELESPCAGASQARLGSGCP